MTWRRTRSSRPWPELWQEIVFPVIRDIVMLGTGVFMLVWQTVAKDPNSGVIVGGLALTLPAAAKHGPDVARQARAVLSGPSVPEPGPPESLPSSSPPSSSPALPPPEGTNAGGHGS